MTVTRQTKNQVAGTLKVCAAISTQKSLSDLVLTVEEYIGEYLGFEGVGILFKDTVTNGLFSL